METQLKTMTVAIQSGNFTEKGNFSGYNASGVRIHVSANSMKAIGYDKANADKVQYPLFACVVEREFDVLNDSGEPTGEKFTRLQAGSIFKTKEELINAVNADKLLGLEAHASLQKVAKTLDLTEEMLKVLESSPF